MAGKSKQPRWKKNGVQFGLENEDMYLYQAFTGGNVSREELRKEYSRLRSVAKKRLERMTGTRYENTQTYLKNINKYGTLEQIENMAKLQGRKLSPERQRELADSITAKKLQELYRFLTAKTGSIKGMREVERKAIETLRDRGYTFINRKNIQDFGEYMEYLRALHMNEQFDSERAGELFGAAEKKGIPPEQVAKDFSYWVQHVEELKKLPKAKNPKNRTAKHYKKLLLKK